MVDQRSQAERWVSFAAGIVTPVTLITALLLYFGYVSARSQYEYFGIDVDTIGPEHAGLRDAQPATPAGAVALFRVYPHVGDDGGPAPPLGQVSHHSDSAQRLSHVQLEIQAAAGDPPGMVVVVSVPRLKRNGATYLADPRWGRAGVAKARVRSEVTMNGYLIDG
jgi:hypothetical protein